MKEGEMKITKNELKTYFSKKKKGAGGRSTLNAPPGSKKQSCRNGQKGATKALQKKNQPAPLTGRKPQKKKGE